MLRLGRPEQRSREDERGPVVPECHPAKGNAGFRNRVSGLGFRV